MTDSLYTELDSPVGTLLLVGDGKALTALYMDAQRHRPPLPDGAVRRDAAFREARAQLTAYFAGELREFELPLSAQGTAFQRGVWQALRQIPFGQTESYGGLSRRIGKPGASRAVGLANGRNPIGIIVPCHRVIGKNGTLTGYGGGLARKQWLLDHERRWATELAG
jgi:methylated-DNA-[protein]-cysteine S-methyltransferase